MRKVPHLKTDEEAEAFQEQDVSGLDFQGFKPMRFEIAATDAVLNMRLPAALLDAVKANAKQKRS